MGEFLSQLLGNLGGDVGQGLLKTGLGIYGAMNQADALNFQKNLANKSFNMQQEAFDMNKEKEKRARSLDFTSGSY